MTRREQGRRVCSRPELVLFGVVAAGAVAGMVALGAGWIEL